MGSLEKVPSIEALVTLLAQEGWKRIGKAFPLSSTERTRVAAIISPEDSERPQWSMTVGEFLDRAVFLNPD